MRPLPPVVLFGYDSSAFTQKVRLCLRLKQIPYTFVQVPSMMPRPTLSENFGLTYRKIPVVAIGKDFYIDTSCIIEALEQRYTPAEGFRSLYPPSTSSGRTFRPLIRGIASYWIDRPFFRVATGLIPAAVWRTSFGKDRAGLIGHEIDADKLEKKIPQNLSLLDMHLSILEPMFTSESGGQGKWMLDTQTPSMADVAVFYFLDWAIKISKGEGIENLTGGGTTEGQGAGSELIFNPDRYPSLMDWYSRLKKYASDLKDVETRKIDKDDKNAIQEVIETLSSTDNVGLEESMIIVPAKPLTQLDEKNGLTRGTRVSVAPDDTGRWDPTFGRIKALSSEEIVIEPEKESKVAGSSFHFPRLGFVVRPVAKETKL